MIKLNEETKYKQSIESYKQQLKEYKEQLEEYKLQIKDLQDKLENVDVKAVKRPTTTLKISVYYLLQNPI
jgi:archaellum component FlaC